MGWGLFGNGNEFQKRRRMLQQYLAPNQCVGYQATQTREARVLLRNLLADSDQRDSFIRRYIFLSLSKYELSTHTLQVFYGYYYTNCLWTSNYIG